MVDPSLIALAGSMRDSLLAAADRPAGGAELTQIAAASAMSLIVFLPLLITVVRERHHRITMAGRLADRMSIRTGLPRWLALPLAINVASVFLAGIGVYWDVPIHVDFGRDEGPLANPSHYLILFGLLGTFASGILSCGLAGRNLPRRTFRLGPGWRVPYGSVLVTFSGAMALSGFPLDDIWHRLYGQDVTEWGPTHVLMIGGAIVSLLGYMLLLAEARQLGANGRWLWIAEFQVASLWLLGITSLIMEFEVGVAQFPIVAQVVVFVLITTWAFVYARDRLGPGGALAILASFLVSRTLVLGLQVGVWEVSTTHFLLYLAEALIVEGLALGLSPRHRYAFGAAAGLLIGSLGVLAEWPWTHLFMPMPWPAESLPRLIGYGVLAGLGAGLIVAWQLTRIEEVATVGATSSTVSVVSKHGHAAQGFSRLHGLGSLGAVAALLALIASIPPTDDRQLSAEISIEEVDASGAADPISGPAGVLTLTLSDPSAADQAMWFYVQSWQGGGQYRSELEEISHGVYRSAEPIPIGGEWKTMVRLHLLDRELLNMPVYLPADDAIPVSEVAAESGVTRDFVADTKIMMREQKTDVPSWLWGAGYGLVFLLYAALFAGMAWLYRRSSLPAPRSTTARSQPATHRRTEIDA